MKNNRQLRKLIREFLEGALIVESMTMGIVGFSYGDDLENILDICNYVDGKIRRELWDGFTDQTKKEWWSEIITPDGSDAFKSEGVINFYVSGIDLEDAKKVVGFIRYILGEKDIVIGEIKWEKVKEKVDPKDFDSFGITDGGESYRVIRIPIVENNSGDSGNPPVVNLSNDNARKLFGDLLGYDFDGGGFDMDARDLVMKVDRFIEELPRRKDIPDRSYQTQDRNIFNTVNGKEYYSKVLDRVREFGQWAIERGYNKIYIS